VHRHRQRAWTPHYSTSDDDDAIVSPPCQSTASTVAHLERVAKLARSRVAANGAAPPGAEPWAVTSAFPASTRWGCSRTGPALSEFCNARLINSLRSSAV